MAAATALTKNEIVELTTGPHLSYDGAGIARTGGQVVFIAGALTEETVQCQITTVKKSFAKATVREIITPSPQRVPSRCPAAAAGAGCCQLAALAPATELAEKELWLKEQLRRIGKLDLIQPAAPAVTTIALAESGWRTRVRLGVDQAGRAGFRAWRGNDIIPVACIQVKPGLLDGIVGSKARRFTPGAELIVVASSDGTRQVVEAKKQARGRRIETFTKQIEGSPIGVEQVGKVQFQVPVTGFWQAHVAAAKTYSDLVEKWVAQFAGTGNGGALDLYGGVGLFVPALAAHLAGPIVSVDTSKHRQQDPVLSQARVKFVQADVAKSLVPGGVVAQLCPQPQVVVLDPPRSGTEAQIIARVAQLAPQLVVHVGCDAATLARDLQVWQAAGYQPQEIVLINAFPGTVHLETMVALVPTGV